MDRFNEKTYTRSNYVIYEECSARPYFGANRIRQDGGGRRCVTHRADWAKLKIYFDCVLILKNVQINDAVIIIIKPTCRRRF